MRNRSNSGVRLDYYQRLVNKTILKHQNPVTGLFPASDTNTHAWVRDNVYSIMAVWGLALAYRKTADLDEDRAKSFELEQSVVKLMRGLLRCMMMQVNKLEKFKYSQNKTDALHAKYCSLTGKTVVGDTQWGHLQIDATSLYLLMLAQITASGLQIVYTLDEVSFVQNLVFYIESAYRTPDYGIWERGDKTNHGFPELNSSSIGMAKAALEAINELDLFGSRGGPHSVVHVLPDEAQQCQAILHSMLPRESNSKEIDAALLSIISFPAFAVDDTRIIDETKNMIKEKLQGKYGCARFLRDGHWTAKEDRNRLHYEPWELQVFEHIECQWPMFFAYLLLDAAFFNNKEEVQLYSKLMDTVIIKSDEGIPFVPEMYAVPNEKVDLEKKKPQSQERHAIGKLPQLWGESLYILAKLITEGFLSPGELDPLNRRLVSEPKPDIVVQVVVLAEDNWMQDKLEEHGISVQTVSQVNPIHVYPARVLTQIYSLLGKNKKLGLTGRPSSEVGLLATSKLYVMNEQMLAFIPQNIDSHMFYLSLDMDYKVFALKNELNYVSNNWRMIGRPTIVIPVLEESLDSCQNLPTALVATIKKLQSGYIAGTRVHMGKLRDFLTTSCVTKLSFLPDDSPQEIQLNQIMKGLAGGTSRPKLLSFGNKMKRRHISRKNLSVHGSVRRSRSIQVDPENIQALQERLKKVQLSSASTDREDNLLHHLKGGLHPMSQECDRAPSPVGSPIITRHKFGFTSESESVDQRELIEQLNQTEVLHEQADIIHYLVMKNGPNWKLEVGGKQCTLKELLVELYEKAGHWKQWWLVRHTAGMLKKRVEELALSATDLLVRQKQLSVGLPSVNEKVITAPLPPDELAAIIFEVYGEDLSTASLTQELLIYLAMFIRTEPKLFKEMLRLRVGLIIQVMASELARTLKCSGDEASDHLLNLSPFEMKTLLHHILSGKEFIISAENDEWMHSEHDDESCLRVKSKKKQDEANQFARLSKSPQKKMLDYALNQPETEEEDITTDRQGQWLRRRRLDGALNRVPEGFYPRVWKVLSMCSGLSIEGKFLPNSLTREMTPGEFKFALRVETVLNTIPQPEYRQLMVEALIVLTMVSENEWTVKMDEIHVDKLVHEANALFIKDQDIPLESVKQCEGSTGICLHFYDSAPSGRFGTMSYLCRALANILDIPSDHEGNVECNLS
ncbi:probable phosphorylase b kinase regulatory subunit alpha isoform X9 [Mytilus californianus]|uniref:probable phosphorylase b kinase regulatory subunit alpha isoform X9 n=1 Tax=Mytilus californianus TaxID=6549 RepID=UPI0022472902|nr:probable phosphorylase b kinase regulatory subunit alpha isoform X9 [Mytilus californianus]